MAANPTQNHSELAHRPAPSASKRTPTDFSRKDDDDDDPTSSSGSDSSDSDSDSDNDAESNSESHISDRHTGAQGSDVVPPSVPGRPRPYIHRMKRDNSLLDRLSAFLPQMKSANEELQREIEAGRGRDVRLDEADEGDEGRYIEMNLGLGVLEEKRDGDDSDEEDEKDHTDNTHHQNSETAASGNQAKETDVLGKLMGNKHHESSAEKPSIQEINE